HSRNVETNASPLPHAGQPRRRTEAYAIGFTTLGPPSDGCDSGTPAPPRASQIALAWGARDFWEVSRCWNYGAIVTVRGRNVAATNPTAPNVARTIMASPYERSGVVVSPATRTVPAMAVPREEPRFEMLR